MSNINLLPWRLARAQRQKKQFGIMIGLFLAATAVPEAPLIEPELDDTDIVEDELDADLPEDGEDEKEDDTDERN